jgi:hypothetical protein
MPTNHLMPISRQLAGGVAAGNAVRSKSGGRSLALNPPQKPQNTPVLIGGAWPWENPQAIITHQLGLKSDPIVPQPLVDNVKYHTIGPKGHVESAYMFFPIPNLLQASTLFRNPPKNQNSDGFSYTWGLLS